MYYIDVNVDEQFAWEIQLKSLTRILSYKLYTLKSSKFINSTLLNMIYTISIQPCLDYACSGCFINNVKMI